MLENARDCGSDKMLPDEQLIRVTKVEFVLPRIMFASRSCTMHLTEVHLVPLVMRNITSYGNLDKISFKLMHANGRRSLVDSNTFNVTSNVYINTYVLEYPTESKTLGEKPIDVTMAVT